ncbi:quinone-dependent dihydroorotate dehydrogenase [Candidatus Falkowbacteria bacterium]|nr:quinone-dependent dihydroorotate dehydrogenase [Candidatus Falkowbacteria bacterium]
MKEMLVTMRNAINRFLYTKILKPIFFQINPETVHDSMIALGKLLGSNFVTRSMTAAAFTYSHRALEQTILGLRFKNPIGLAAGFDKNAVLTKILPSVGFGFAEVGSITGRACAGNPRPRLWRLQQSHGLVVYYGLKNDGCEKIVKTLNGRKFTIPLGISIAKTNCPQTVETTAGIADYCQSFATMESRADYLTINISCPNAFGGRPFTQADDLDRLLTALETIPCAKPIFLKLPPDLTDTELDSLITVCDHHRVSGFICTNLTKDRNNETIKKYLRDGDLPAVGGISGQPIQALSTSVIKNIYRKTKGQYIIIGCGGVFSAADAYAKIKAGASLIQLITGMIFEGPQVISEINQGLVKLLRHDGYQNIAQAVGADYR